MGKYKKLYTVVGGRDIGVSIPFCVSTALVGRWMEEIHSSIHQFPSLFKCSYGTCLTLHFFFITFVSWVSHHLLNFTQQTKVVAYWIGDPKNVSMPKPWSKVFGLSTDFGVQRPWTWSRGHALSPVSCNEEDKKAKACHVDLKYRLELSETLLCSARKSDTEAEVYLENWHCFIKDSMQWSYHQFYQLHLYFHKKKLEPLVHLNWAAYLWKETLPRSSII